MTDATILPNDPADLDDGDELELACSSCNASLTADALFQSHRVCARCRRHYWLAGRDRIALLLDAGSFRETNAELVSIEPLQFRDRLPVADRRAEEREQPAIAEAVITGTGTIDGSPAMVIALDLAIFGAGVGIVAGEKIALAIELAVTRRLPVIAICSSGAGHGQEGVLALAQIGKLAVSAARLRRVGMPLIALLTHPTTGNVVIGLANQADVCFAEPGAHAGLRGSGPGERSDADSATALLNAGAIDAILDRDAQRPTLGRLLRLLSERRLTRANSDNQITTTAHSLLERLTSDLIELHGDRSGADNPAIRGALARIGGTSAMTIAVPAQDGDLNADAFAKVNRLLRLAAHLELPVIVTLDGCARAESAATTTGLVLAQTLALQAAIPVPIVTVASGELRGLAAMTLLTADRVVMTDQALVALASGQPVATARECLRLGVVDSVLPADAVTGETIAAIVGELSGMGGRRLLDERTRRLRQIGLSTPEGRAAAHHEWHELQEMQQALGRSLTELRRRWEHRQMTLPALPGRQSLTLPNRPSIAMPKLTIRRPDLTEVAGRVAAVRRQARGRDASGEPIDPANE